MCSMKGTINWLSDRKFCKYDSIVKKRPLLTRSLDKPLVTGNCSIPFLTEFTILKLKIIDILSVSMVFFKVLCVESYLYLFHRVLFT